MATKGSLSKTNAIYEILDPKPISKMWHPRGHEPKLMIFLKSLIQITKIDTWKSYSLRSHGDQYMTSKRSD